MRTLFGFVLFPIGMRCYWGWAFKDSRAFVIGNLMVDLWVVRPQGGDYSTTLDLLSICVGNHAVTWGLDWY